MPESPTGKVGFCGCANIDLVYDEFKLKGHTRCSLAVRNRKVGDTMKVAKWLIALVAVMMFVGCAKSDEQKAKDAAEEMQKDAQKALDGVKVPSLK